MTCTVCSKALVDEDEVFSDVTGAHKFCSKTCVEGSPHRHERCGVVRNEDSPAELFEAGRKGLNKGGF